MSETGPSTDLSPREQTRAWFREAKFGLFIHWGVYALLGKGEWIRTVDQIPAEEYAKLPPQFNPTAFDPDAWAALARRAGTRYMVVTTKHHDGFCMFDAHNTAWQVTKTPYGRDVLRMLTESFERAGLKVGYYYSIMDWHHDDYLPRLGWEEEARPAAGHDVQRYVAYMREHLEQLLTEYRPAPFVIWYDGGWVNKPEELGGAETNAALRRLKPDLLINDRHFTKEDLVTPEQRIPPTGLHDEAGEPLLWEACLTMTSHWWGYDAHETVYKTSEFLIRMLVDIVSKGGNLLLNIGPKPDGTIQDEFVERLEAIGAWLDQYGEAIYGTTASPFNLLPFHGRATVKGDRLYLHIFEWPADGRLRLPNLGNRIRAARLLGPAPADLTAKRNGTDWVLSLPAAAPDPVVSVIAVDLDGAPRVEPLVIRPGRGGLIKLPAVLGYLDGPHGMRIRFESRDGQLHAGNWLNPKDSIEWTFEVPAAGDWEVRLDHAVATGHGGSEVEFIVNGQAVPRVAPNGLVFGMGGADTAAEGERQLCRTRATGGRFQRRRAVLVRLEAGRNVLKVLVPSIAKAPAMELRGLTLRPVR